MLAIVLVNKLGRFCSTKLAFLPPAFALLNVFLAWAFSCITPSIVRVPICMNNSSTAAPRGTGNT